MDNVELGKWYIDQLIHENEYSDELEHYGRKGQKWGVRRGPPPYPIESGKKSISDVGTKPLKYRSIVDHYLKQIGGVTSAIFLLSIPGYFFMKGEKERRYFERAYLDELKYNDGEYTEVSKFKKKTAKSSALEDAKQVNSQDKAHGRVSNCALCTAAWEMRRRGYDVEARRSQVGTSTDNYEVWFNGLKYRSSYVPRENKEFRKNWVQRSYDTLTKSLEKNPEGSRGFLAFRYEKLGSGHTISWEIKNGEVVFYDSQNSKNPLDVDKILSFSDQNYLWGRLDNCKPTDEVSMAVISKRDKKEMG